MKRSYSVKKKNIHAIKCYKDTFWPGCPRLCDLMGRMRGPEFESRLCFFQSMAWNKPFRLVRVWSWFSVSKVWGTHSMNTVTVTYTWYEPTSQSAEKIMCSVYDVISPVFFYFFLGQNGMTTLWLKGPLSHCLSGHNPKTVASIRQILTGFPHAR